MIRVFNSRHFIATASKPEIAAMMIARFRSSSLSLEAIPIQSNTQADNENTIATTQQTAMSPLNEKDNKCFVLIKYPPAFGGCTQVSTWRGYLPAGWMMFYLECLDVIFPIKRVHNFVAALTGKFISAVIVAVTVLFRMKCNVVADKSVKEAAVEVAVREP